MVSSNFGTEIVALVRISQSCREEQGVPSSEERRQCRQLLTQIGSSNKGTTPAERQRHDDLMREQKVPIDSSAQDIVSSLRALQSRIMGMERRITQSTTILEDHDIALPPKDSNFDTAHEVMSSTTTESPFLGFSSPSSPPVKAEQDDPEIGSPLWP
ncbi:MAG: hypothetical protein Q9174_002173 [Haloplaca sp. 1 TL-2023]